MQYVNPNYHSWVALPLIGNLQVNNLFINNVFTGIDKFDDNYIYVLINLDGSQLNINYVNNIINYNENYINHELVDIDLLMIKFKIKDKIEHSKLISGNYDEISKKYHSFADSFIAECVRNTWNGFLEFYKMLFLILDNSPQLITDYWMTLYDDESNWLIEQIKNSGKYFSAPSDQSNNLFTNYMKNVLKKEYAISI